MANIARPGSDGSSTYGLDVTVPMPGMVRGTIPFGQWVDGRPNGSATPQPAGFSTVRTDVVKPADSSAAENARAGSLGDREHPGIDWFEKVHAIPGSKIEFGNIITQVEDTYEIYSAFRAQTVTLGAIQNNALPGVALPDSVPPVAVPPQTSIFRNTTTQNNGGAGLGTIVLARVQALTEGLPIFDTNIEFDFNLPGNDVQLLVSGSRIVLIPFEYEKPTAEVLQFFTNVIPALSGNSQRIKPRKNPRQQFRTSYLLDANQRQRMQVLLFEWMDNPFAFPIWRERMFLTSSVGVGATLYPVTGADDVELRVGGLAVVIQDDATFDVINISAVTDTLITADDPSLNAYVAGTRIMPLRTARILRAVPGRRAINNLELFQIHFEVTDNDTGLLAGDITPGFWSLHTDGRVLFDDCNVVSRDMPENYNRRVFRIDNQTGIVKQISTWDMAKRSHEKGFFMRNRAEIMQFRRLMLGLNGRQKSFWIPTFAEDLTVVADLVATDDDMDIEAIAYVRLVRERLPMTLFRITFTDDTSLVRTIISSATISSTVERLTLNTTWPAARTVEEIVRVEFYELCVFSSDEVLINYPQIGQASCRIPVERAFDLN